MYKEVRVSLPLLWLCAEAFFHSASRRVTRCQHLDLEESSPQHYRVCKRLLILWKLQWSFIVCKSAVSASQNFCLSFPKHSKQDLYCWLRMFSVEITRHKTSYSGLAQQISFRGERSCHNIFIRRILMQTFLSVRIMLCFPGDQLQHCCNLILMQNRNCDFIIGGIKNKINSFLNLVISSQVLLSF